jgi:hypothetical protein
MTLAKAKKLREKAGVKKTGKKPTEQRILSFLRAYKPSANVTSEGKLKIEIYTKLKQEFDPMFVTKESGRNHADIELNGCVPVELKYKFGKSGLDRLMGQIERYLKDKDYKKHSIILLLYKRKNDDGFGELKKRIRKYKRVKLIMKE